MKKFLIACSLIFAGILGALFITYRTSFSLYNHLDDEPDCLMTVEGKNIFRLNGDQKIPFSIKGVDMGAGIPGSFATEFAADYDTYRQWFRMIGEMNANVVRVYTIQNPAFYHAFYDHNRDNPSPLYLLHGVWVDDDVMRGHTDAYDDCFLKVFKNDCRTLVDVLHGRRSIGYNSRHGRGNFKWDVSPWVAGYILGVEWEREIVLYTDDLDEEKAAFQGHFLYTDENASGFEGMLARVGDEILTYEMKKYGDQKLLAFSNWPETDPLEHSTWQLVRNANLAKIDAEHICSNALLKSGMFASYHIYPYFPEFLDFEEPFCSYVDRYGKVNPYAGYLKAINDHHSIPVVISEFGLPSARGIGRINTARGMNCGHMSEAEQAEKLPELYRDILDAGCAGACVFSWQDEWFKRTWNTWSGVNLQRNAYWSDCQTNEQCFGLITFDPGKEKSIVYVDGDTREWEQIPWLYQSRFGSFKGCYDEKFIYFLLEVPGYEEVDQIFLPIDITPKSGAMGDQDTGLRFRRPVDFLIRIDGEDNSGVFVQEYYDMLYATERREIWKEDAFIHKPQKDSEIFHPVQLFMRHERKLADGRIMPPWLFPTGELRHGDGNPGHKNFDSLTDFCIKGERIEIRIPWTMLNFSDPSMMQIHDDYYEYYGVREMDVSEMLVSMQVLKGNRTMQLPFASFPLKGWGNHPTWHTRVKASYYAMQKAYGEVQP